LPDASLFIYAYVRVSGVVGSTAVQQAMAATDTMEWELNVEVNAHNFELYVHMIHAGNIG
jgi:hypothetical protein